MKRRLFLGLSLLIVIELNVLFVANWTSKPIANLPNDADQVVIISIDCCERDDPLYADLTKVEVVYGR